MENIEMADGMNPIACINREYKFMTSLYRIESIENMRNIIFTVVFFDSVF